MGLAALIGAVFSLIQYPLFIVMEVWFKGRTIEVGMRYYTRAVGGGGGGGSNGEWKRILGSDRVTVI